MKRRTFLASVPLAAVGFARTASAQTTGTVAPLSPALPATQFFPDVQAGDRPVGPASERVQRYLAAMAQLQHPTL